MERCHDDLGTCAFVRGDARARYELVAAPLLPLCQQLFELPHATAEAHVVLSQRAHLASLLPQACEGSSGASRSREQLERERKPARAKETRARKVAADQRLDAGRGVLSATGEGLGAAASPSQVRLEANDSEQEAIHVDSRQPASNDALDRAGRGVVAEVQEEAARTHAPNKALEAKGRGPLRLPLSRTAAASGDSLDVDG